MSTIEQTLNAGVPVTFPGGEQFHLLKADEPVNVTFYDSRNRPIETWEGMKGGFRIVFEKGFIQVRLESTTGQTVKLGITSGRGEYDRSQGDVNVLNMVKDNSWYYDSKDKKAFLGGVFATATSGIKAQIWNPAASGKLLLCSRIKWFIDTAAAASYCYISHHNAALTNAGVQGNKYLNEAAGVGLVKYQDTAGDVGTHLDSLVAGINYRYDTEKYDKPIVIGQGRGLVFQSVLTGTYSVQFQWAEIPA